MSEDLEHRYAMVVETARDDVELALEQAEQLVSDFGDQASSWFARSYVNMRMKNHDSAILDVDRAIELEPDMPRGYNTAGEIQIEAGKLSSAVDYLSVVIEREDMIYRDRFLSEALTFRAFAYMKLGEFRSALDDLSKVEMSGPVWLDAIYTKEDLVSECKRGLGEL